MTKISESLLIAMLSKVFGDRKKLLIEVFSSRRSFSNKEMVLTKSQKSELESIAKEFHPWWSFAPSERGADLYIEFPYIVGEDYLEISAIGDATHGAPSLRNFAGNWLVSIHNKAVDFDVKEM